MKQIIFSYLKRNISCKETLKRASNSYISLKTLDSISKTQKVQTTIYLLSRILLDKVMFISKISSHQPPI